MCPRTKEQNEAIRQQRLIQIRHTAAELLLERGMRMEMGDIAEKAGLGRGTVYHYYNSKVELFEELLAEAMLAGERIVADAMQTGLRPSERLAAFARASLDDWAREPIHFILYLYAFHYAEPLPIQDPQRLLREFRDKLLQPVLHTIEEGIRLGELTAASAQTLFQTFVGALVGAANAYIRSTLTPERGSEAWAADVVSVLMNGMRA
ncbi:TetR/AcrR family transcriptional regulator [Paenibacillus methanolicus]|uniref:AcrR family transcriptional regulator n=1 Tax=Paenibacillus methanolicus TaxID=582686 RepID=A0A5S5C7Z3_9BACL|nr:TetR/AcrR family transcriptional regulator [Paenibacillus methanolicus]TYP75427.1 AcrR family transcriptional regulator [Paenibacillus methanolicus]